MWKEVTNKNTDRNSLELSCNKGPQLTHFRQVNSVQDGNGYSRFIRCDLTGKEMTRVEDIIVVYVDSSGEKNERGMEERSSEVLILDREEGLPLLEEKGYVIAGWADASVLISPGHLNGFIGHIVNKSKSSAVAIELIRKLIRVYSDLHAYYFLNMTEEAKGKYWSEVGGIEIFRMQQSF